MTVAERIKRKVLDHKCGLQPLTEDELVELIEALLEELENSPETDVFW